MPKHKLGYLLLPFVVVLAACTGTGHVQQQNPTTTTGGTRQEGSLSSSNRFADPNRFLLDVPSVVGTAPMGTDGRPGGPQAVAALRHGDLRSAGRRKMVFFIWGAQGDLTASQMVNMGHQSPGLAPALLEVREISPRDAPRFDPAHQPPGTPRAFRIVLEGAMVSIALPRAAIGENTYLLICGDGPTVYPDRVTRRSDDSVSQDGMWLTPAVLIQLAHGMRNSRPITHAVTRPLVWR